MEQHEFWNSKPLVVTYKPFSKVQDVEIVQQEHGFTVPDLPASLVWDSFCLQDDSKIEEACSFLEKNYFSKGLEFVIVYSKDHIRFELDMQRNVVVAIRSKKKGGIVGLIMGSVRDLRYQNADLRDVLYINFLCVQHELRHLGLAPKLITEISRYAHETWGIQKAYYTSHTKLPIPFSTTPCYHYIMNVQKSIETGYYVPLRPEMERLLKRLPLEKRRYSFQWPNPLHEELCEQCAKWTSETYHRMKVLYENITKERIRQMSETSVFEVCVVYNRQGQRIGYISVFRHPSRAKGCEQVLENVILYHYGFCEEEDDNLPCIFKELIEDVKDRENARWDVLTVADPLITHSSFVKGEPYHHYMYNVQMPEIPARGIGIVGL